MRCRRSAGERRESAEPAFRSSNAARVPSGSTCPLNRMVPTLRDDTESRDASERCRTTRVTVREESGAGAPETPAPARPSAFRAGGRTRGTPRLLLRPPTRADLPHIQRYAVREPFYRFMDMDVPTPESVNRYLATVIAAWDDPQGKERVFAVEPRRTGRIAGLIRIAIKGDSSEEGSVGYSLDPDFQSRGYATEALQEVVRLGFEELGLRRIRATVDSRNERSWKVLERAGFRRTKPLSGHRSIRGFAGDSYLYAIRKGEQA